MNIDVHNFWDSCQWSHPTLSDGIISEAEKNLGVKLPALFVDLLKIQNGGYTKGFVFPMKEPTTWAENHIPLSELFGIVTDQAIETDQNILDSNYMINEWGLPKQQVLLTGDGHWWITLDYTNGEQASIRWIDMECNENIRVADNFESFIAGLILMDDFVDR